MTAIPDRLASSLADRYVLERELGEGGMATVYLARDLRHDRRVAIKVLRPELGAVIGADRFLSEIRTTANLQHPNILPLFDSGDAQGLLWYAMPYVEGETLRDRLQREKQLPVSEAVRLATEVASALDYAHRQGIIHRDIKPENILLHDGRPLVADFGIALAASKAGGTRMTETGMSLGTPHYMSPEQAMGERELDARSDVYALGAVLYECLTGDPPFTGSTAQAIVAKVVTEKPSPPSKLRDTVPPGVEDAVLTALQKLPADRFASAKEFAEALARPSEGRTTGPVRPSAHPPVRLAATLAVIALLATIAAAWGWLRGTTPPAPEVLRFASTIPAEASDPYYSPRFAFSPDSRTLVYRAADDQDRPSLFVRRLDALAASMVTEGIAFTLSPDGTQIVFATRENTLQIMPLSGGGSRTLADGVDIFAGVTWGGDGTIYFERNVTGEGAIWAVSERGGEPRQVVAHDTLAATRGFRAPRLPFLLPGDRAILVTYWRGNGTLGDIAVADLVSGKVTYLAKGTHAQYADGFLTFVGADGQLMAAPFDTDRLALDAPPRATGIQVGYIGEATMAYGLAPDGTLVYSPTVGGRASLVWVDRSGREEPVDPTLQRAFTGVSISPDGRRLALGIGNDDQESIWVYDPAMEAMSRLTFEGRAVFRPLWSPDGSRIAYVSDRGSAAGIRALWWQPADGTGEPSLIAASPRHAQELTWSADGSRAAYRDGYSDGGSMRDIHVLRVGSDTTPRPFLATPADEQNPKLSPDGRWLAYVSDESGRREVYVRPFPDGGGRWQVSADGAVQPLWRRDGREIYFLTLTGDLMVVPVLPGSSFSHGRPQVLFPARRYLRDPNATTYDITPDGSRFLFIRRGDEDPLVTVIHWTEELRRLFGSGE